MSIVYVLELKNGKYYVGVTDNVDKRFAQHLTGDGGAAWTKLHEPIKIIEERISTSLFDEEKVTKDYMLKYGIENVRGGPYSAVELDSAKLESLEQSIWSATDSCMRCGRTSHFISNCYAKATVTGRPLAQAAATSKKRKPTDEPDTVPKAKKQKKEEATIVRSNSRLSKPSSMPSQPPVRARQRRVAHEATEPSVVSQILGGILNLAAAMFTPEDNDDDQCYRCGRSGHWADECYARLHIDGTPLR